MFVSFFFFFEFLNSMAMTKTLILSADSVIGRENNMLLLENVEKKRS